MLGASALAQAAAATSWKTVAYAGFVESVDELTGPSAIDCGFLDWRSGKVSVSRKQVAARCVNEALNGKQPFRFGTVPPESNVIYVLLRSAAGELWQVRYSRFIANQHLHETQFNQTCRYMTFDEAALIFQGLDCKLVSNGGLPTYDAQTRH
jgi:hypothetical protein